MLNKKFLLSFVLIFVLAMLEGGIMHGMILAPEYAALVNLFRPHDQQEAMMPFLLLAHVFLAGGFVWIYLRGKEDKPWLGQGLRYGLAVAVLAAWPIYLIYFCVQPMPGMLVFKQMLFDTIGYMVMGAALAAMNK